MSQGSVIEEASPLHQAIIANGPTRKILNLIDREPMAAQFRLANGRYPLHDACRNNRIRKNTGNVIIRLLKLFPQAAQCQDEEGYYPLQIACQRQSDGVIFKLIEVYPEAAAVQLPDASGSYPLHVACQGNNNNGIMKLLEVFPQAAKVPDAKGWYPLHIACNSPYEHENVILKLLEIHPDAGAEAVLHGDDDSLWQYPLQLLNHYYHIENVVRTLAQMYPAALQIKTKHSNYPIHQAFRLRRPLEIIQNFINLDPSVIHQSDGDGDTVLHHAIYGRYENKVDVVGYLLELPNLNVNATTNTGDSALHIAISCVSFHIVNALLRHPFIMIDQRNHNNETPIDLVDKKITELQNRDDNDNRKSLLPKYQQLQRKLKDHLQMTRWGSYEYFFQKC